MLHQLFRRIYGSTLLLKQLPSQRHIAYISPEALRRLRDKRIKAIVRYAAQTVPYYQELFRTNSINYRDIRTADDLDGLPFITKEMVRDDPDAFVSRSKYGQRSVQFITSGTTGTPLRIRHDIHSIISNIAYCEPEKEVVRRHLERKKNVRQVAIIYSGSTLRKIWGVYSQYTFLSPPPEGNILFIEDTFKELISKINSIKPDVINGYGSHLEALFKYATARNIRIHQPELLNYGADGMTETGKGFIKDKHKLAILSRYGSVECFRIGYTCEYDEGFHIHEDLCDLKIIGPDGTRLADGVPGEVVITNLVNKGTVLLNYRLGDIAAKSAKQCSCGRNHPLLTDLIGRSEDFISLPNSEVIHPRVIWNVFKNLAGVVRYQLIQHEESVFELKIVTKEYSDYEKIMPDILVKMHRILGDVQINSKYYEEIEALPSGKFRPVISHIKSL